MTARGSSRPRPTRCARADRGDTPGRGRLPGLYRVTGAAAGVSAGRRLPHVSGQLPLFSLENDAPEVEDVEGLLLAGGAMVRRDGMARISIVVDLGWRTEVLAEALDRRGLGSDLGSPEGGRCSVRSRFDLRLLDVAAHWTVGARTRVPPGFSLTPARLRFWVAAAGTPDHSGFLLRLAVGDEQLWEATGAALAAAGLPAAFLGVRAGGPAYRVVGARRLSRLRELAGRPPSDDAGNDWPR